MALKEKKALRSKTGCFTCRRRKKKCDESHPKCLNCCRNKLDCNWPPSVADYSAHQAAKVIVKPARESREIVQVGKYKPIRPVGVCKASCSRKISTGSPVGSSELAISANRNWSLSASNILPEYAGSVLQSNHEVRLFNHYCGEYLSKIIVHSWRDVDTNLEKLRDEELPWGLKNRFTADAFLANSALDLSAKAGSFRQEAFEHYGRAVREIQQQIRDVRTVDQADKLIHAVLLLCMFDKRVDPMSKSLNTHLGIVGELFQKKAELQRVSEENQQGPSVLNRVMVESYIYHLTTSPSVVNQTSNSSLKGVLLALRSLNGSAGTHSHEDGDHSCYNSGDESYTSPILSMSLEFFGLIYEVVCYSRQSQQVQNAQMDRILLLREGIMVWLRRMQSDAYTAMREPFPVTSSKLYGYCGLILLELMIDPMTAVSLNTPRLNSLLEQGIMALMNLVIASGYKSYLIYWPLFVLATLTTNPKYVAVLEVMLDKISKMDTMGGYHETRKLLKKLTVERASRKIRETSKSVFEEINDHCSDDFMVPIIWATSLEQEFDLGVSYLLSETKGKNTVI